MTRSDLLTGMRFVIAVSAFSAVLALNPGHALAQTNEKAAAICKGEVLVVRGALEFQRTNIRRRNAIRFVYGIANFADSGNVHVRCRVYRDKVISLSYLVRDSEFIEGKRWVQRRPRGTDHQGIAPDEDAMALPPVAPATPRFERAPF